MIKLKDILNELRKNPELFDHSTIIGDALKKI